MNASDREEEAANAAVLLQFVAPGLMHGLGNSLFAIHGHAQLLRGSDSEIMRSRVAILKGTEKALQGLDILRHVLGEPDQEEAPQAGILLGRLCDYVRIPLRERGVRLQYAHVSTEAPLGVSGTVLCRTVLEVLRHLVAALPNGFEGCIHASLLAQRTRRVVLGIGVESGPSFLPFPVDLVQVIRASRPLLERHGAHVESSSDLQQFRLVLPAVPSERDTRRAGDAQLAAES